MIDPTRAEDGALVAIKVVRNDKRELQIAQFLSSIQDSQNHSVPIFQVLPDPLNPNLTLMVMPYLRPCNDPEFWTIGEVIAFIDQTVEVRLYILGAFIGADVLDRALPSFTDTMLRIGEVTIYSILSSLVDLSCHTVTSPLPIS